MLQLPMVNRLWRTVARAKSSAISRNQWDGDQPAERHTLGSPDAQVKDWRCFACRGVTLGAKQEGLSCHVEDILG